MEAKATVKYVRISPQKARRAVDLVRGRQVEEARRILRFSPLGASKTIEKALRSALRCARASTVSSDESTPPDNWHPTFTSLRH